MNEMKYEEFKEVYMDDFDGYVPTYVTADEEFSEKDLIKLDMEFIAPWRMTDGPSRFFRVISIEVNKEQYKEIIDYFERAGENWKKELTKGIQDCLEYSNNFEEL